MIINAIKRAEIALMIGIAAAMISGAALSARGIAQAKGISQKLIRLHIIANSDSERDQSLKLKVRDAVLPVAGGITSGAENAADARKLLMNGSDEIKKAAIDTIRAEGEQYGVDISFENCYFPTREYNDFALPAGEYEAVRIIIGDGGGKNWWCVMFPPLCLPESEGDTETLAELGGLDKGEIAFISEDGSGYKIKFKAAELCAEIYHKISGK